MTLAVNAGDAPGMSSERAIAALVASDRTPPRPFRDLRYVRIVSTGTSFLLFGVVGTFLGILIVPLLLAIPGSRESRRARVRHMIRLAFRALVGFMNQAGAISYSFPCAASLGHERQLVISNHPSLIDIVLLIAFVPGAACVVKRAAWRNPSMVVAVHAAGFVPNSPTDEMIEGASARLAAGECLIMFPEGTRTVPDQPAHFHRGAASVALRAARVVTPVFIDVHPPHLAKAVPWYQVPVIRPHYSVTVGPDIDPGDFRDGPAPIASRALNERFKSCYAPMMRTT
jgi:1-acyl-sn-glycerol-3-phosphate acyltransferase